LPSGPPGDDPADWVSPEKGSQSLISVNGAAIKRTDLAPVTGTSLSARS
jgi:hypothetical protein